MDFQAQGQEVTKPAFVDRVAQAMVKTALAVLAEEEGVAGHEQRCQYAVRVLASPTSNAQHMARGVVTNPNAGTGASDPLNDDGALEFVISSMWSGYAGYYKGMPAAVVTAASEVASFSVPVAKAARKKTKAEPEPDPEPVIEAEVIDEPGEPEEAPELTRWQRFKKWWLGSSD